MKNDIALYPISTQRNLAVAPENISMPLNPDFYGSRYYDTKRFEIVKGLLEGLLLPSLSALKSGLHFYRLGNMQVLG